MRAFYKILSVSFAQYAHVEGGVAEISGQATVGRSKHSFELLAQPVADGHWLLRRMNWQRCALVPRILHSQEFKQSVINTCRQLLSVTNMWPTEQTAAGAKLSVNRYAIPEEFDHVTPLSFRPAMLDVPSASWSRLWYLIERRLKFDESLHVLGFSKEDVEEAFSKLRQVFPASWIKARFRTAGLSGMGDALEPDNEGFFPAYHLARIAQGAICRDPGLNYLVEIGLAIRDLEDVDGAAQLIGSLTKSPGNQHHVCLAADLQRRGHLLGLEPSIGGGAAKNDILASGEKRTYQIEVKEFSSRNPLRQLKRELAKKSEQLQGAPPNPVVFHVVFRETGAEDVQIERAFFREVRAIEDDIPDNISAVVVGRRFVDSLGGTVKRDVDSYILNPRAVVEVDQTDLGSLFAANYETSMMPHFGIGSLFVFGSNPKENNS